ncbi:MAG TPA: hypothetical protein VHK24_14780 [Steroidobacter sp.]|nr:hypothetical protein [Steroidobacter sp.]
MQRNSERLVCYDQVIAHLTSDSIQSENARNISPESMFGANARNAAPQDIENTSELKAITAKVTSLHSDPHGFAIIGLDNGQSWRQISNAGGLLLRVGEQVTISRGALDSFRLATPSGRAAKVKRIK